jgi:hypothetical protein
VCQCADSQPSKQHISAILLHVAHGLQGLLAVRPELPDADIWSRRVQQVHETWAHKLYTRDRDITPGELGAVSLGQWF